MITTVSMSPAIDKRLEFDGFMPGGTNRVLAMRMEAAGKGVDVAFSARALSLEVCCVGLLAGAGEALEARLDALDVPYEFLPAPGAVRVNQKLYDRKTGIITEINEPVPEASPALLNQMADAVLAAARQSDYLVLTGSLPTGCPQDWYARIIARVRTEAPACRCVLDAEGERLRLGAAEAPWLVKPNQHELSLFAGHTLSGHQEILTAARALLEIGPEIVVVSMGGKGAMAVSREEAFAAPAIATEVRTTTGAGDAMVAGLLHGAIAGESLAGMLRHGLACAGARCGYAGERYVDRALFDALLPHAAVEAIG